MDGITKGLPKERNALQGKTHQPGSYQVDKQWAESSNDDTAVLGRRPQRSVTLAGNYSIYNGQKLSLPRRIQAPILSGVQEDLVEIKHHPPHGVITIPVSSVDRIACRPGDEPDGWIVHFKEYPVQKLSENSVTRQEDVHKPSIGSTQEIFEPH